MAVRRHGGSTLPPILRKAILWALVALISLAVLGFIGCAQLLSYLQGDDFRDSLEKVVASKTHATSAEIDGTLGIDANRVSLRGISVQRPGMLHGLAARGIHAELNRAALFDRELHLTRIMAEEGSFSFDADHKAPQPASGGSKAAPSAGIISQAGEGFLASLAPTRAQLDRFDIKDFNANLRLKGEPYTLTDSSVSANPLPRQGKQTWELRLNNGRVHTPLPILGDCSLKNATLTVGSKVATLSDARFILSPGELIINAMMEHANGDWTADIRANSMELSRLIGDGWKQRLRGVVYGRLHTDGHAGELQRAEGKLSLQQGVLEPLPFLANVPIANSYPYRQLRFEKATARLSYPHEDASRNIRRAWLLDQIDLRAEGGWLRIGGHALVDADGSISGALLIGIPENIGKQLAPIGSPLLQSIFNAEGEAGYLWVRLNLSGSINEPQEDLSVRLKTLLSGALPQAADALKNLLSPAAGAETSAGTDAQPAPAGEAAPQLLNEAGKAAGELIGSGLRSLF